MPEKGRLFTGARARFSINGIKVGYARNVAVTEEIQYDPVEILDNIEVEEFVPVAYRVTFTASQFRIIGETVKSLGFFPNLGANTEEHLENILGLPALPVSVFQVWPYQFPKAPIRIGTGTGPCREKRHRLR